VKALFSSFAASLAGLALVGCTQTLDECECPPPPSLASGVYVVESGPTAVRFSNGSTLPQVGGTDFQLEIDAAQGTARLMYLKAGKRVVETWRKKQR
jgi:hypothetical protein